MSGDTDPVSFVCDTTSAYLALGNETFEADRATFVRNRETPRRYDANHVTQIRCRTPAEIEALLARAEREYEDFGHRRFDVDPFTPPEFVARLVLDGFGASDTLQLLLEDDLRAQPQSTDIRLIESEEHWRQYAALEAMDAQESAIRQGRTHDDSLYSEFTRSMRLKCPPVNNWLAYVDGEPRAYFASWAGVNGVGMVEDLFTHPDFRHRGLATALIAHCVADARALGAGPVLIGADPTDTPRHMYAAMGFRPLVLERHFLKRLG